MSVLGGIAAAAVSGVWKIGAIAAVAVGVASSSYLGYQWHMAAHDRDVAAAALATEKAAGDDLRTALREQNLAVESMGAMKARADERRATAEQLAAANGRRLDRALEQGAGVKAITCAEAMPTVNKILEAVR